MSSRLKIKPLTSRGKVLLAISCIAIVAFGGIQIIARIDQPFFTNYQAILTSHKLVVAILDTDIRSKTMEQAVYNYAETGNTKYKATYILTKPAVHPAQIVSLGLDGAAAATFHSLSTAGIQEEALQQRVITLTDQGKKAQAIQLLQSEDYVTYDNYFDVSLGQFDSQSDQQVTTAEQANEVITQHVNWARYVFLATMIIAATILAISLSLGVVQRLQELETAAIRIGKGELTVRVPVGKQDEIGRLAVAFNKMAVALETAGPQTKVRLQEITKEIGEEPAGEDVDKT